VNQKIYKQVLDYSWALLVLLLPITSMPIIVRIAGSNTVGALSGILLFILLVFWFIPNLFNGGKISRQFMPLLVFTIAAIISTLIASFSPVPLYKEFSSVNNEISSLITLFIGIAFYLITSTWIKDQSGLSKTLRYLNWGGLVLLVIAGIQALSWYTLGGYPEWLRDFHNIYSVGPLFRQRPTGMSYEPSWLANQLNMLYLPYWLAATIKGYSSHNWRIRKISLENLLLFGGVIILTLTLSRVGMIAFFLMLVYLLGILGMKVFAWGNQIFMRDKPHDPNYGNINRILSMVLISTIFIIVIAMILFVVGYGLSQVDRRMAQIFQFSPFQENAFLKYAENLDFGSRIIYWEAGWRVFNKFPFIGVGLGNTGFYFPENIPSYGWKLMEVREFIFRLDILPNLKSIWVRILAECGITGFILFLSWLYVLWQASRFLVKQRFPLQESIGLAGQFTMIALIAEGFSLDSFAMPYLWISLGIVTACSSWVLTIE